MTNHLSISIFLLYSTVKEKKNTFARVKIITSDHRFLILFMNPFLSFDQRRQGLISFPAFWIISRYSFTMPGWIKSTGYETYARIYHNFDSFNLLLPFLLPKIPPLPPLRRSILNNVIRKRGMKITRSIAWDKIQLRTEWITKNRE